jgi:cell division transport system permease protein
MKPFRMIGRNMRDALKSVFRNFSLSIASISCITITLILVSLSLLSSYNIRNITDLVKKDFTIVTFLDKDITKTEIDVLKDKIKKLDNISTITFESKQAIADSMMKTSDVFKNIMSKWDNTNNPLKDTFLIKVKKTEKISITANDIKELKGVSLVRYGEGMVEQMLSIFKTVEKALLVIVISLVLVTAFLIANTIKLTIFSRRKEIEIMRLVGASNINIEIPFILEGLILGIMGSIIPIGLVIYGYSVLYAKFNGQLFSPFVRLVSPEPFIYIISLALVSIGIVVGMLGSFRAVRKHLKI